MHRAYSLLTVKSIDEDERVIEGIATTPSTDRMGDVVETAGASFRLPVPLLWQHRSSEPIGQVIGAEVTTDGIRIRAKIAKNLLPRIDEAWALIKSGLVRGLSIGFRPTEDPEVIKGTWGLRFNKWEWLELSAVTIPANADASITTIRSIDASYRSASGATQATEQVGQAGVSAAPVVRLARLERAVKKTISERITEFEQKRAANVARMNEIQEKAADEGRSKDETERTEFENLKAEVKAADDELVDLREMDTLNKAQAKPVVGTDPQAASVSRQPSSVISVTPNRPAGIGFARVAKAKLLSRLDGEPVMEIVRREWPDDLALHRFFQKAAVPAGTTTNATWAGNLVDTTNLVSEFVEYLRPQTIIGRIPNLRRVPFNVRVTGQTTGAVANWVGQGKGKPVTSFSTNAQTLLFTKIAAIAVVTEELVRFSSPSAEALVRDELARAVIERMDVDFIDPNHAAVANVNPASITNGVTPLTSAGTSADNIRTDLQNLLEQFILNNMNVSNVVLVMPNTLALAASLLVNSLGQPEFPSLTPNGGSIMGIPVVTSQYAANQSGSGNLVIALDPTAIFLADDGQVSLTASGEASIEMSDAPTQDSTVPTGSSVVSMFQTNSLAIKAERYINWAKFRTTAVSFIDDANWGSIGSPS